MLPIARVALQIVRHEIKKREAYAKMVKIFAQEIRPVHDDFVGLQKSLRETKFTATVHGLPELKRVLKALPNRLRNQVLRGATRAGAKVVLDEARKNINSRSGLLAKSLRIKVDRTHGGMTAKVSPGRLKTPIKKGATAKRGILMPYYAGMVEFGTKPHLIRAKQGKAMAIGGGKGTKFLTVVRHPGANKTPFLKPALEENTPKVLNAFYGYAADRIEREINKPS